MKRVIYILVLVILGFGVFGLTVLNKEFDSAVAVRVNIPKNATNESIQDSLSKALGVDYGGWVYRLWSTVIGDPARAHGSYVIEPGTSAYKAARTIASGNQTPVKVTFNNVRTIEQFLKQVGAKVEATPAQIDSAMTAILKEREDFGNREKFPAAFVPDTYEFYWTDTPEHIVNKMLAARDNFWTPDRLAKAEKLGLTPVEVATIASIVEEESAKKTELPIIARLYVNRVQQGMKLQADPTVKFATGNFALRRITGTHLKIDSPYNTYRNAGLPPGPIRIPEKSTIDAVLNAPKHDYLYMCAKSDFSGYHNFTSSYAAHAANARKYQNALNARKIRS